mgnify:FL=1
MSAENKLAIYGSKEYYQGIVFLDSDYDVSKPIYKYMDVESAINFLQNKLMSFVEPSSWFDPFEKRFYNADFSAIPNFKKPKIFASCFTNKATNEAAWVMYSYFKNGLASKSIRLEFNPTPFYDMLNQFGLNNNARIVVSRVNYKLSEQTIKALHKKSCTKHQIYFANFDIDKFINLMLIKRKAFDYEKEIRIFIIPSDDALDKVDQKKDYHIPITWDNTILTDLVKSITISPNCTPLEREMIEKKIEEITNGAIKCRQSSLYKSFDTIRVEP